MRGILRDIFVPWRKDERNFSIVHTDLLMYIVIKYRMRYNIIKDLWLYEPRIIYKERTKGGLNKRATVGAPLFSTLLVFPN